MSVSVMSAPTSYGRRLSGGVHPPEGKELAEDRPIEPIAWPEQLFVALGQNIGVPCQAVVKPKTEVELGQKIGDADAMVSAPVHAPVAGTTGVVSTVTLATGQRSEAVPITPVEPGKTDAGLFEQICGGQWELGRIDQLESKQIIEAVREAGIVGMGGAAFPTHVKLMPLAKRPIDTLIINGCECEPYLTSDYRLMLEAPQAIVAGMLLARKACGAEERAIVAIEDNKPKAIETMRQALSGLADVEVVVCRTRYPMGGERSLVPTVVGRSVPVGGLPLDVGVVVVNVGTASAIAGACLRSRPVTHRIVSVTGSGVAKPSNLLVPIGARFADLIEHCGGLLPEARRIIAGGPMMGFAVADLNTPVTKGTSGITIFCADELDYKQETNCVRCGRCADVCPLDLVPTRIAHAAKIGNLEMAERYYISACVECGCCTYGCPSRIPLVQHIRVGKAALQRQAVSKNN